MGDLNWTRKGLFCFPENTLRYHAVALGSSGSGKTETQQRIAYGARKVYQMQVIYLDAKGETKRDEEQSEDNAARFVASMQAAGARTTFVFPSTYYNGWQGTPTELKNRLLSVIDYSESAFYGDVAANILDLALHAPQTPRNSRDFLANLRFDRLKALYQHDRERYQRVLALDKNLLKQVEMRYQVFFQAMAGQLDGTLDYADTDADAIYLRVRGFALHNEAPRLGRFLIEDFKHYIAERRRVGTQTLLIIDEFNALRMREETSLLFEQVRSFGGSLVISAQGYTGLGPPDVAERILDACSTYILHACSDPFPVSKRAGKHLRFDVTWSENDEEGAIPRRTIRPVWDWKISEDRVRQQENGQAYWSYRGKVQQVQTARVPLNPEQIGEGWKEIQRQEAMQRMQLDLEAKRRQEQQDLKSQKQSPSSSSTTAPAAPTTQKKEAKPGISVKKAPAKKPAPDPGVLNTSAPKVPSEPEPIQKPASAQKPVPALPIPDPDDDEPDRL